MKNMSYFKDKKIKNLKVITIMIPLVAFLLLFDSNFTFAQSAIKHYSLITPQKYAISLNPGQKFKGTFTVTNKTATSTKVKISVMDTKLHDENGALQLYMKPNESVVNWIIPQYLEISLGPNQQKEVGYIIKIPENASSGGHNGAILLDGADQTTLKPTDSFGMPVLINVLDNFRKPIEKIKIADFSTSKLQFGPSPNFSLKLDNPNNSNLIASGTLIIKDWKNKEIDRSNTGSMLVYPESDQQFSWKLNKKPSFGLYKAEINVEIPGLEFYKLSRDTWFLSLPW